MDSEHETPLSGDFPEHEQIYPETPTQDVLERLRLLTRLSRLGKEAETPKEADISKDSEDTLRRGSPRMATSNYKPRMSEKSTLAEEEDQKSGNADVSDPEDPSSSDSSSNSGNDSSSDSSHGKLPVPKPKANAKKRKSIVEKLSEDADKAKQRIIITQNPPSYTHIRLESLSIMRVLKFIEQVHEYQLAHKISLPLASLIAEKPRRQIMARNKGLTLQKFFQLNTAKLIKLLMREVKPESTLIFLKVLDRSVTFELPHSYRPSAVDFIPLYNALLLYRSDFTTIVDVLSDMNDLNIPPVTNKDGGLIHLFLKKIPFDYGKHVVQTMKPSKYKTIHDFLSPFYKVVERHMKDFERSKSMNQFFSSSLVIGTQPKASQRPSGYVKRHHVNELAAIQEGVDEQEVPSEESEKEVVPIDQDETPFYSMPVEDSTQDSSNHSSPDDSGAEEALQQLDNIVKAPVKILPRPKTEPYKPPFKRENKQNVWVELFDGNCQNKNCPFSHDYALLRQAHQRYTEKLMSSKYRPKAEVYRNSGSIHMMIELATKDAKLGELMTSKMIHDVPESAIIKAVRYTGTITTLNGANIVVSSALFDCGALSGSFIGRRFARKHHAAIKLFRVKVHSTVKLADNKTSIEIDEAYMLTVTFDDGNENDYTASVLFYDCNHEMTIGLPAILKHFHELHAKMISSAVADLGKKSDAPAVTSLNAIQAGEVRHPWSYVQDEEAPEDAATPLPCSFTDALHYMEMSYDQAVEEYLNLFETHVEKQFKETTNIIELLRNKGVNVFVPQNWEGIKGVPEIELVWKDGLPDIVRPKARPVNPKLYENAQKEFERLKKYMYVESSSPIASCLVIAPKATHPFIRFCGDYVFLNKYIECGFFPIPHVQHTLETLVRWNIFLDFDLVNSFHQFKLGKVTSERLSIQTVWGQYAPVFMPEGIGPASGYLQKFLSQIFEDYIKEGWCIVIFDNLLAMASDYDDAYQKVDKILDRCVKHNIYLKFSKTWLGFKHANFFGYVCRQGHYELSPERKQRLSSFLFPLL